MRIRILWVGRTKEPYLNEGIKKYLRLLHPYVPLEIIEFGSEKAFVSAQRLREKEGERILRGHSNYILLDETGKEKTSMEFAGLIRSLEAEDVDFVLGGAFGVSDEVKRKAGMTISLSRMTMTHEMARLFFLEQLYRAFTIIRGKPYHH